MPYVTLTDLIDTCPQQLEANTIIVFDGCHRVLQQIPDGITCEDVLACVDCDFLLSLITFSTWLIVDVQNCTIEVDPAFVNTSVTSTFDCTTWNLIIWTTTLNLACIADLFTFSFIDGLNTYVVHNGSPILVQGLHWLQMSVWANIIQVDLPIGGTTWQVLTWNAINQVAYRANPIDVCCDQIQSCMAPIIAALQAEISIIAGQLCPCAPGLWTPMVIYDEGVMVHNTSNMNFIWSCITAVWNNITNTVDLTFDCAWSNGIDIYDDWVLEHSTVNALNFKWCLESTWNAVTSQIDVEFIGALSYNSINGNISLCWSTVNVVEKYDEYQFTNNSRADISWQKIANYWYLMMDNTPECRLSELVTPYDWLRYRMFVVENKETSTLPSLITPAAWVTINSPVNGLSLVPGAAAMFIIQHTGAWATIYTRIS